jgi:hypothetical protein
MEPLNFKLYDLARAKLNLNDTDAMEFVSSIHELQDHRFENLVTKEYLDQKLFGITEKINTLDLNSIDRTNNLGISLFEKISQIDSNSIERTNNLEISLFEKISQIDSNSIERTNNLEKSLTEKMNQIDSNSIDRTNKLETKLSEKINNLENSISEFKADNLKWMFIFWVGQMSVTIAVVMIFIKR